MKRILSIFLLSYILFFSVFYYENNLVSATTYKVLAMGDSNTAGVGNPAGCTDGAGNCVGYRKKLKDILSSEGISIDFVGSQRDGCNVFSDCEHEGWSGRGIAHIQGRVSGGIIGATNPDIILLSIGANDMWVAVNPKEKRYAISNSLAQQKVRDLDALVNSIYSKKSDTIIIIAKPTTPSNARAPLGIYRAGIDGIETKYKNAGKKITTIDLAGSGNDGVHFTPSGHENVAQKWAGKIKTSLNQPVPVQQPVPTIPVTPTPITPTNDNSFDTSRTYKILLAGDSNTVGAGNTIHVGNPGGCSDGAGKCVGHRKKLKEILASDRIKIDFVGSQQDGCDGTFSDCEHEGYGGRGISNLQSRVNARMIETYNPDAVLLNVGANDIKTQGITNSQVQQKVRDLDTLIGSIYAKKSDVIIIIAKISTPRNNPSALEIYREGTDAIELKYKNLGKKIYTIDLVGSEEDGAHFTPSGHESVANKWADKLKSIWNIQTPIVTNPPITPPVTTPVNPTQGSEITQYPLAASTDSGSTGNVISNRESSHTCSNTNFNGVWKKSSDQYSGKLILEFQTEVYPKQVVVYGVDPWFTKLEAWNGTGWKIIWMGESSNCVTEMNVRETDFKTKKIRITAPMGKFGGIHTVKLKGNSNQKYEFPVCSSVGENCAIGKVCTNNWKNSKDTSMCCTNKCENRIYAFSGDMSAGFTPLDLFRVAKELNMNYYKYEVANYYNKETNDDANEFQTTIDFYEKTENSNINQYISFRGGESFSTQYNANLQIMKTYPKIKAAYVDDASNRGYKYISENIAKGIAVDPNFVYILVGYSSHLSGWSSMLGTYYGPNSAVGKNAFWTSFGGSIPCVVKDPGFGDIAKFNAQGPANKVMIGLYVSSYSSFYCTRLRNFGGNGWDPNDAAKQRVYWTQGIKAGAGGIFFWNPWMFSSNSRGIDYYAVGSIGLWPKVSPSSARSWTPPGVVVSNSVDLAQKEIPDLCPYCSLCGEDKIYMEDGFFGATCCNKDEIALGNDCFKKETNYQWVKNSEKTELIGEPSSIFSCYGNRDPTNMWTISTTTNIPQNTVILDYKNPVYPSAMVLYGSYMAVNKIEAWNGNSWTTLWSGENKGYCLSTINFTKSSFATNKIRLNIPSKNLGPIHQFTRSGIDAAMLIEENPGRLCTEEDWESSISPESCPESEQQIKTWTKIDTCEGGITHTNTEQVSCTHISDQEEIVAPVEETLENENIVLSPTSYEETSENENISENIETEIISGEQIEKTFERVNEEKIKKLKISTESIEVEFTEDISINSTTESEIEKNIFIQANLIKVNTENLKELNKSAKIKFKGKKFTSPVIIKDGIICLECKIVENKNETITIEVKGFSTYQIIEKTEWEAISAPMEYSSSETEENNLPQNSNNYSTNPREESIKDLISGETATEYKDKIKQDYTYILIPMLVIVIILLLILLLKFVFNKIKAE